MSSFSYFHLCKKKYVITTCLIISLVARTAIASDNKTYDVTRSWFKPSLKINNDPAVCEPLLEGYLSYFKSTKNINPLEADFQGERLLATYPNKRLSTDSLAIIAKVFQEVKWKSYKGESATFMPSIIAEDNLHGHYFAIARRYYWRGSGEFHEDILTIEPLSSHPQLKENQANIFEENEFRTLLLEKDSDIFDVIYPDDSRSKEYDTLIDVEIANFFSTKDALYLLLKTNNSQHANYLLAKLLDEKRLSLTCSLQTVPERSKLEEQIDTMPVYKALKDDLLVMMGNEGNCGSLHALFRAEKEMTNILDSLLYRPWIYKIPPDNLSWRESIHKTNSNLKLWGYSGIWNYQKYRHYLSHRSIAEEEIKDFFFANFFLSKDEAADLANDVIRHAIVAGFDHGLVVDEKHLLHKDILEGSIGQNLKEEQVIEENDDIGRDSLLTFAIERPDLMRILLEKGLNPNKPNTFGKTPLMYASQFNAMESAKLLLENGAYTEATTIESLDNCNYTIGVKNVSALHYAVRFASADFIRLLLDHGAPTFIKDSNEKTPYDYLMIYGHCAGNEQIRKVNTEDRNKNLTEADLKWLGTALQPPEESKKGVLSKESNLKAEKLYREGKLQEAYNSLRRAISLDPNNERALSNLSLAALKLGMLGESAKVSTKVIETAHSDAEKANAYFNLGLVCKTAGMTGYHYATISYDGETYCDNDKYGGNANLKDTSALPNFLAAYKLKPTQERLDAIFGFLQDADPVNKKRIWKFNEDGSGIKSLYLSGMNFYFLIDASKQVPFTKVTSRYQQQDKDFHLIDSEVIPLTETLKLERLNYGNTANGSVMLDYRICSSIFPVAFGANTKLVEIFSPKSQGGNSEKKNIVVKQAMFTPVLLLLYGENVEWTIEGDISNIAGVYIHGRSNVTFQVTNSVPVFSDNKKVEYDPKDTSFNRYTRTETGLPLYSVIDVGQEGMTVLTDDLVENNRAPFFQPQ